MLFNSYAFVFLFFPVCLILFYGSKRAGAARTGRAALILLSLWFYGFVNPDNLPVLLGSMAVNYGIWLLMKRSGAFLWPGIGVNLLALFFFKYTGSAFVPLGISFFTFSQIAFLVEGYKGKLKNTGFGDYALYLTFFPKLIQGPIAFPEEMEEQADRALRAPFDWEGFYRGLCLFILGLSKKVLLADVLGRAVDQGYGNLAALNSWDSLIVMLSYTLQIYFDFSGYCDMAQGTARMLGFSLPVNFDSPYRASNIIEFWKGWHMTLTRFFTRYLYIPLGGSRRGRARTYGNILIVFLVSGIWHGAGLSFVVWGMLHGVLYVVTRWRMDVKKDRKEAFGRSKVQETGKRLREGGKHALCVAATFLYVNAAWVFFRAPSLKEAVRLFSGIFSFRSGRINRELAGCFNLDEFWYVIKVLHIDRWQYAHYILMAVILAAAVCMVFFAGTARSAAERVRPCVLHAAVMAVLLVWCILTFSNVTSFIYFNF
ncbi:MAG: MBOAT family protein [Lachnospiraceae bacterium]|nr:MBOAT family protein [Lachnospiraceae bacterium]